MWVTLVTVRPHTLQSGPDYAAGCTGCCTIHRLQLPGTTRSALQQRTECSTAVQSHVTGQRAVVEGGGKTCGGWGEDEDADSG